MFKTWYYGWHCALAREGRIATRNPQGGAGIVMRCPPRYADLISAISLEPPANVVPTVSPGKRLNKREPELALLPQFHRGPADFRDASIPVSAKAVDLC
jgi:hypothetical protein